MAPYFASADYLNSFCSKRFLTGEGKKECAELVEDSYFQSNTLNICHSNLDFTIANEKPRLACAKAIRNKIYSEKEFKFAKKSSKNNFSFVIEYLSSNGIFQEDRHLYKCSLAYEHNIQNSAQFRSETYGDYGSHVDGFFSSALFPPVMIAKEIKISAHNARVSDYKDILKLLRHAQSGEESIEIYDLMDEVNSESPTEQTLDQIRELLKELDQQSVLCPEGEKPANYDELIEKMIKTLEIREL